MHKQKRHILSIWRFPFPDRRIPLFTSFVGGKTHHHGTELVSSRRIVKSHRVEATN